MSLFRSAWVIAAPSIAAVPTVLLSVSDCCWVTSTTVRASVPAATLSALLLLVKSSNSDTLMPVCALTDASACSLVAPLATSVCTRVVSGLTTAGLSAGAVMVKGTVTGPWSASIASVPTTARIGYLPASAVST